MYTTVHDMGPFFQIAPVGHHYEFGVCTGNSILATLDISDKIDKQFQSIIGFDSLVGLPEEDPDVWHNPDWPPGAFNSQNYFEAPTLEATIKCLFDKWGKRNTTIELVGWYNDVLTDRLAERLKHEKASYIHIDTDIYKSCYEVMDWVFKHKVQHHGCIWRFDDWFSTPLWTAGESRAFKEISIKYDVKWFQLTGNVFQYIE
jgi:hypothetical protein